MVIKTAMEAIGEVVSVSVRLKPEAKFGKDFSWALVMFKHRDDAALAVISCAICLRPQENQWDSTKDTVVRFAPSPHAICRCL